MNIFSTVTTIDWGFDASDIFTNSMFLVSSLAAFILLGLAVIFAPKLFSLIRAAATGGKSK